jgi:hypothetical protein
MWAATFGNLRNTFGSVSIAVETARPVTGHLIITELMANPFEFLPPAPLGQMELRDRDGGKTAQCPIDQD